MRNDFLFSGAWADPETLRAEAKYYSVKILSPNYTQLHLEGKTHELEALQIIGDSFDNSYLCSLHDYFYQMGPHGVHLCLVMPLYGQSVQSLRHSAPFGALPVYMVKKILYQLVVAVQNIQNMGIIHTGV